MNGEATQAAAELADLQAQLADARAVLIRVLQDTVEAESRLGSTQAVQLLEANEQLVLAALHNQAEAETAAQALNEASRAGELDALTQLPNRLLLLDRFAQAITQARRHARRMALLFLDLDNFKGLNDSRGHAFGDQVLKQVARVLVASIREADTVSRHGGDEFIVLLSEIASPADAVRIADKIVASLVRRIEVEREHIEVTASIGISIYPDDGEDVEILMGHADAAMYRAKRRGSGQVMLHTKDVAHAGTLALRRERVATESDLRQEHLREANERLVLAALGAEELQQAAERAQQRQASFMAVVASELRNPLAPIRIATSMLGRARLSEPLLPRVQALIEQQLAQMSLLLDDALYGSNLGLDPIKLESHRVDLAGLVKEAVAAAQEMAMARGQQVRLQLPESALEVRGDPRRLAQLVGNLLDNASKYTPTSGWIHVSLQSTRGNVQLTVEDNGIGISALALPGIFEPFAQDSLAIGFNGVGMGIGLTVVRQLAQAHGGTVSASSPGSGLGSTFTVSLPAYGTALRP